ncbi:hypothetical protein ACC761_36415 [Rhizobium ruizarguesonis]
MSNENPPDEQSAKPIKSAVITDNSFSFQPGAGVSVQGFNQTVTARNTFTGLGGEGLVIKASEEPPAPPPPEPTPQPAPLPTLWPEPETK